MRTYGIPINSLTIDNYTGVEKYTESLIRELMKKPLYRDEKIILYSSKIIDNFSSLPFGWEWKIIKWPFKGWTHLRLSFELLLHPVDVLFVPAHEVPFFHRRTKIVSTVHDVAFRFYVKSYSLLQNIRQRISMRRILWVNHIIVVSQTTKEDIKRFYGVNDSKISVTHLAINNSFSVDESQIFQSLKKYNLERGDYFISVGRIEKKKNISFLLDVFEKYKENGGKHKLVLAGKFGFDGKNIKQKIQQSKFRNDIYTLGYVSDIDVLALMSGALAYVFPSKYEGFGIPLLEAMKSNVPILASNIPAFREVAQDAALFAGPVDVFVWLNNFEVITCDEKIRAQLILKGKKRLKDFEWSKTAKKTLKILRSL